MRDFFYNKNDVIVAVVIILIAAFVIYMRVGVIMNYPSKAAGEEKSFLQTLLWWDKSSENDVASSNNEDKTPVVEAPIQNEPENPVVVPTPDPIVPEVEVQPDPVVPDPPTVVETDPPPTPPTTSPSEVSITVVAGDVGSAIGDKLIAAGAITDKEAFLAELSSQGAATKLKQGTFKIPAGSTMAEIVKILVG